MKNKKLIIGGLLLVVGVGIFVGFNIVQSLGGDSKTNAPVLDNDSDSGDESWQMIMQPVDENHPEVKQNFEKSYTVDKLKFSDFEYYYDGLETHIDFKIKNTTKNEVSYNSYLITVFDKNGNQVFTYVDNFTEPIKGNEELVKKLSTLGNFMNAYTLEITLS